MKRLLTVCLLILLATASCGGPESSSSTPPPAATSSTANATVTAAPNPVVLRGDGIGVAAFGTPTDQVLEVLGAEFGPPTGERTDMYRVIEWADQGLTLLLSTHDFYRDDGAEHFVGWERSGAPDSPLRSGKGIGIGDTVDELITAHGAQVTYADEIDECLPAWILWLDDPAADRGSRVMVSLDGPPGDGASTIAYMSAGAGYGC